MLLTIFCDCTGQFMSDQVGNPDCWFSHPKTQIIDQEINRALWVIITYLYNNISKLNRNLFITNLSFLINFYQSIKEEEI